MMKALLAIRKFVIKYPSFSKSGNLDRMNIPTFLRSIFVQSIFFLSPLRLSGSTCNTIDQFINKLSYNKCAYEKCYNGSDLERDR